MRDDDHRAAAGDPASILDVVPSEPDNEERGGNIGQEKANQINAAVPPLHIVVQA